MECEVSSFEARLRVPGQARLPMSVVVDITDGKVSFTKGDQSLGVWPLDRVVVDARSDGFHLSLDQEEVVLSVTDASGFAGALKAVSRAAEAAFDHDVKPGPPDPGMPRRDIAGRLSTISPEDQSNDVRQRIYELKVAITDDAVAPPEVFRRWLRLLKEINIRHGQGAIPTPVFYRLNTELLDLIPVPPSQPRATTGRPVGVSG
jgi:hypothetical protein